MARKVSRPLTALINSVMCTMLLRDAVMEAVIVSPNSCDANPAAVNGTHQMFHDVRDSKECL